MNLPPPLILDACVLLNLLATDQINEILLAQAREILVCDLVSSESYYLKSLDGSDEKILVNLEPLFTCSLIGTCEFENDSETDLFVNLAAQLDDGEAKSIAIALSRRFAIATDDKKARRVIADASSGIELNSSLGLVRAWAEANAIGVSEVKNALERIQRMANYFPHSADQNYDWWKQMISS
jgi:predicted nucleic acid-binding protein